MPIDTKTTETVDVSDASDASDASDEGVAEEATLVVDELLVEEVSIDGMCGVY